MVNSSSEVASSVNDFSMSGWLRKFYAAGSDEPHYSLTPAVEKALLWLGDLCQRDFIGTESRLNIIFELLRQMVFGSSLVS
jgi:Protein of unknown function (DUF3375)